MVDPIASAHSLSKLQQDPAVDPDKVPSQAHTQNLHAQPTKPQKEAELQAAHLREAYTVHLTTKAKVEALKQAGSSVDSISASLGLTKTEVNSTLEIVSSSGEPAAHGLTVAALL